MRPPARRLRLRLSMRMRTVSSLAPLSCLPLKRAAWRPPSARAERGLWRGLAEAPVLAAASEGAQQAAQPAQPPPPARPDGAAAGLPRRHQLRPGRRDRLRQERQPGCRSAGGRTSTSPRTASRRRSKPSSSSSLTAARPSRSRSRRRKSATTTTKNRKRRATMSGCSRFSSTTTTCAAARAWRSAASSRSFIDTQIGPSDMIGVMYPLEATGVGSHDAQSLRGLARAAGSSRPQVRLHAEERSSRSNTRTTRPRPSSGSATRCRCRR